VATVFVVGVTLLGGRPTEGPVPTVDQSQQTAAVIPPGTPFPVPPRFATVLFTGGSAVTISNVNVDEVCPRDIDPSCASMRISTPTRVDVRAMNNITEAVSNPTKSHVVIVHHEPGEQVSSQVVVVSVLPKVRPPSGTPRAPTGSAQPTDNALPSDSPDPSATPATDPSAEPSSSPEASPSEDPSPTTSADPSPSETPSGAPPSSGDPSDAPPSLAVTAPPDDGPIVIAADVVVVGRSAAYSPNGDMFAFTARPMDGSQGPDVYLWRVGTQEASPITSDHISIFSGWVGDRLIISRSNPDGDPLVAARGDVPVSMILDPATGEEIQITSEPMFRPTVDPTRRSAVWWDGAIEPGAGGFGWQPRSGRLLLGSWVEPGGADGSGGSDEDVLASGPVPDWDARWDQTGTRLAVWIADREDPAMGTLSLYGIDPTTGRLDAAQPLLDRAPALPGFSIDNGQLVWAVATEGGETRVEVLAWTSTDVGQVELTPDQELIIVR
jgi:hypothetical protein